MVRNLKYDRILYLLIQTLTKFKANHFYFIIQDVLIMQG